MPNLFSPNFKYTYWNHVFSAPLNLTSVKSANSHPLLTWDCLDPDIEEFEIWKYVTSANGYEYLTTTSNKNYEDVTEIMITGPLVANERNIKYKVRAIDYGAHVSNYSNEVTVRVEGPTMEKTNNGLETLFTYSLAQNYPNPFNPSTKISYFLKDDAFTTLKIFDVLGNEVKVLVNEFMPAGNYEISFNASELSSGMYIYKIQAGKFMAFKKMILTK